MNTGGPKMPPSHSERQHLSLWLQLVEQKARADLLAEQLSAVVSSRSWQMTAWLRRLNARRSRGALVPQTLRPAQRRDEALRARLAVLGSHPASIQRWAEQAQRIDSSASHLWVDVSEVDLEDLGAGIQRVTRQVLTGLLFSNDFSQLVVPVRLSSEGDYCYAWRFSERLLGLPSGMLGAEAAIATTSRDAFLGLDFCRRHHVALGAALQRLKANGTRVAVVVYDLLPRLRPDWFPQEVVADYAAWLQCVARHADVAICISQQTRLDLLRTLEQDGLAWAGRAEVALLGSDALAACPRPQRSSPPTLLLVGTVEPRKGHADALNAMEKVWASGGRAKLIFVGRPGWKSDALQTRIRNHPEFGELLEWQESVGDADLAERYASSDLLIMASEGEGYGLPLAEAGRAGCALLARDLAIFREVARDRAGYFGSERALEAAIMDFLEAPHQWPDPSPECWPTWYASAQSFESCVNRMMGDTPTAEPRSIG